MKNAGKLSSICSTRTFYLECLDYDIEYSPDGALDSATISDIKTLEDCQKKCQDEKECKHWTHLYDIFSEQAFEWQSLT